MRIDNSVRTIFILYTSHFHIFRTVHAALFSVIAALLPFWTVLAQSAYASEKIQPLTASFTIMPSSEQSFQDVRVSLHIVLHNSDEGSLLGTKFICQHDIDSISVTDDQGNQLPYTLKHYPRKRIIWEYGPPKNNIRCVIVQFTMRQAVKKINGAWSLTIDWIGGWTRDVFDVTYTVVLPGLLSRSDILYVSPSPYTLTNDTDRTYINFNFPVLSSTSLKIDFKDKFPSTPIINVKVQSKKGKTDTSEKRRDTNRDIPEAQIEEPNPTVSQPQSERLSPLPSSPVDTLASPSKQNSKAAITNIRHSLQGSHSERIVFDLTEKIPYQLFHPEDAHEIELSWSKPIAVTGNALTKKNITSPRVRGLKWKKTEDKKISCIIELANKNCTISHGFLYKPARIFIDLTDSSPKPALLSSQDHIEPPIQNTLSSSAVQSEPLPVKPPSDVLKISDTTPVQAMTQTFASLPPAPTTAPPPPTPDTKSLEQVVSVEERIAYQKAKKLAEVGEFENAIASYEKILTQYPTTPLAENILYDIADATYSLIEKKEPKNYNLALQAYKKALVNYPESSRAAYASFQIAECHRKSEFFIEAASQYNLVTQRYPDTPYSVEARYWMAECLFQMHKFEDALREFEKFFEQFPTGPHARDAAFRIADCYAELKDYERAEFYYEKALKRWPEVIDLPMTTLNNMAMTYYYKGKFEKSRQLLMLSFNLYPSQKERERLLRFAGDSYQWEGDMQKALNMYGLILDMFPNSEESAIAIMRIADLGVNVAGMRGDQFFYKDFNPYKEPEKAYQWITENAKTAEVLSEAYYKLGFTLAKQGKLADAVEYFKKSISQPKSGMYYAKSLENIQKILIRIIHTAVEEENFFAVVETYKKNESILLKHIDDCNFLYDVAKSYAETGFYGESQSILNKILMTNSSTECSQKASVLLGSIDIAYGNLDKACERLNTFLYTHKPHGEVLLEAYRTLGDAHFQSKRFSDARDFYALALQNKEVSKIQDLKSLLHLGEAFGKTGYYYNAIQILKKVLANANRFRSREKEIAVILDDASMMIGDFYQKKAHYDSAAIIYRDITQRTPSDDARAWAYLKWGEVLIQQGNYDNATRIFNQLLEKMPNNFLCDIARSHINSLKWRQQHQSEIKDFM